MAMGMQARLSLDLRRSPGRKPLQAAEPGGQARAWSTKAKSSQSEAQAALSFERGGAPSSTGVAMATTAAKVVKMGQSNYHRLEEGKPSGLAEAPLQKRRSPLAKAAAWVVGFVRASWVVTLYYAVGVGVYGYLEGWKPIDVVYFLTVTSTTVGYGDFTPVTMLGKLFTCFYALLGITVVLAALAPLVSFLKGDWREKVLSCCGCEAQVDTTDLSLTMEQVNRRINYPRRYALALLGPGLVMVAGIKMHFVFINKLPFDSTENVLKGLADSIYFTIITMSTIGYGDESPHNDLGKLLSCIWLPIAVVALADAISDVQMIRMRRMIRETDFEKLADECLERDAMRDGGAPNPDPVLSEGEFIVDQLLANELVDKAAVVAIKRQYKTLTSMGEWGRDEDRVLDAKQVYETIRRRVQLGKRVSAGVEEWDVARDPASGAKAFKWPDFESWKMQSWQPRLAYRAADEGRDAYIGYGGEKSRVSVGATDGNRRGIKTVVGANRRNRRGS